MEVVGPEILVDSAVVQHVPDGGRRGGSDSAHRPSWGHDAGVGAGTAPGDNRPSCDWRPRRTGRGSSSARVRPCAAAWRAALACALIAAGAKASPGDEVGGGWKAAHVDADLGPAGWPGRRGRRCRGGMVRSKWIASRKGSEAALHLGVDLLQRLRQRVVLAQVQAEQESMALADAPAQRGAQLRRFGPSPGDGTRGEALVRIEVSPGNQRPRGSPGRSGP